MKPWAKRPNRKRRNTRQNPRKSRHLRWPCRTGFTNSNARIRGPNAIRDAIGYATPRSRSHDAVVRVYDAARESV